MSADESGDGSGTQAEQQEGAVETDTKFVEFQEPELGTAFRWMVVRFEPERQSIPHGSGYVGRSYRQYVRISQGSKLQVTDTDVYSLIQKLDDLTHHDMRDSTFWAFLRWLDSVSWARLPDQYRTTAAEWEEKHGE